MRSIRQKAGQASSRESEASFSAQDLTCKYAARIQTSLTITQRSHDQLPPVTTYRRGFLSRVELWIKRRLKRATHWYTLEQVNFNSAVNTSLSDILAMLTASERRVANLELQLGSTLASKASLEGRIIELESVLTGIQNRFDSHLVEKLAAIRSEQEKAIDLLLNEQRVCLKQLALEISEVGIVADRSKRSLQLRLDALADRLEVHQHREIKTMARGPEESLDRL